MNPSPELGLVAHDTVAVPIGSTGPAPAQPTVGVHSLRELVDEAVAEAEAQAIGRALATAKGNKSLAARILRTNYTTLHAKMKRFKISAKQFRPG